MPASRSRVPYYGARRNVGAYERPFSGVGEEFEPLGIAPGETGFVLHETGYWPHDRYWNFPNVYSPFWRAMYDYKAGHAVRFGGRVTPLGPGRVHLVPNHQRFDCMGDPPVPSLWFAFSCRRSADPRQPMPIEVPLNPVLRAFVDEFPEAFRGRGPERRERIRRLSESFLLYLLGRPEIRWQAPAPESIARVVALVNGRPGEGWRNPELARRACMSEDGFIRAFRQWMNRTPARYVAEVRIREACRMMTETERSIDAIAEDLGFPDRFCFSRVFKRLTGLAPARYRKSRRQG
jgi:AraC-like DNA-binding protein